MGLQSTISNAVATAKKSTLELWAGATYKSIAPSSYNASTGAVTSTSSTSSIKGLFSEYLSAQVDGNKILSNDYKMLILQSELSFTPDINDLVTYDSKDWAVINITQDPASAIWEIQLRVQS